MIVFFDIRNNSVGATNPFPAGPTTASHLVVLGGRDEEEDGGDGVEALEPAPPLRALAAHVHHFEGHVLDLEVVLVDALGGLPGQEDVLLAGEVALRGTPSLWSLRCKVKFERPGGGGG